MRFTHIDVNFYVRYEGHQNCPKILSLNILRVFSDHHLWRQNWCQYVWTSLCQFNFLVNLLYSLGVWFFDIWHLFDNMTSFWQLDIFLTFWVQIAHGPHCPCAQLPISLYPIVHVPIAHVTHTPVSLLPICPIPLYPIPPVGLIAHMPHTPVPHTPSGSHCPYAPYPLYPIAPCVPISYVPHTSCTHLPLWASLAMCPTHPVPHFSLCPHCPCGPYPMCPHRPCAPWHMWAIPLYPIPPVHYCPIAHQHCPPLGNGPYG